MSAAATAPGPASERVRVLHDFSSLRTWGGMLRVFARLAPRLARLNVEQFLFARTEGMSPMAQPVVESLTQPPAADHNWKGLPLPRAPAALRRWRRRALARAWNLTAVLNWGRFGNRDGLWLARQLGAQAYYWEHGAAWLKSRAPHADFLTGFDGAMAVSEAGRVMLRERWGFKTPVRVIHNAVWDDLRTNEPAPVRRVVPQRPLRLGFAGRLVAFKGAAVALHTLAHLKRDGVDAMLDLAGDGPDLEAMRALAGRLAIADRVTFRGYVADMEAWYRNIDVLLHPALREPFGLICAEALCWGAPVVTVAIDGLPEVVEDGVDGYCVVPRLPMKEARSLGFSGDDVPELVYHTREQKLAPPRIADPAELANAVRRLAATDELETMSRRAAPGARQRFALGRQARSLISALTANAEY